MWPLNVDYEQPLLFRVDVDRKINRPSICQKIECLVLGASCTTDVRYNHLLAKPLLSCDYFWSAYVSVLSILSPTFLYLSTILSTYSVVWWAWERKACNYISSSCSNVSNYVTGWYPQPRFCTRHIPAMRLCHEGPPRLISLKMMLSEWAVLSTTHLRWE